MVYVTTRKQVVYEHTTGAVDYSLEVAGPARLYRVHITFSETPASEDMVISLTNADGAVTASHTFGPATLLTLEVTRVFFGWALDNGGGAVNVAVANTGDTVTSIVIEYDRA